MGSGNTKLNSIEGETESISSKTRPTLIGRLEEFRKRWNIEYSLSKKELLKDAEQEDGSSDGSKSSSHEINETENRKVSASTKEEATVPLENSAREAMEEKDNIDKDIAKVEAEIKTDEKIIEEIVKKVKKEMELQKVSAKIDDNDSDEETGEFGRYLCRGSPSFRIYCIEADKRKAEEEKEKEEEERRKSPVIHQKSHSADSVESIKKRNTISSEVPQIVENGSNTKRKGSKMRKFGAVRTLLKVKSCYYPISSCTGDNNRSRPVPAKAAN
ncbi:hypothetical protein TSUD_77670 [Trifolium subterraneum]|uniref:Uncharacterized protein n=1 Tax=Trifolium subterraneum TaxID=3900 RepID=A0A2Z6P9T0_TRISU|nr:hypothetical protein TSUD_77670 [Trifolium subterraneum]